MIAKPGKDHTIPTSYRPISLLSCLSKLFEKCVLTRIVTYLRLQEGIASHQFGFRERHGTVEQVNRISSEIRNAFEKREFCTAIFLDVSQAFDRLGLEGLMYKIKTMLSYNTHKLLEFYIYDRRFVVRCNTAISDDFTVGAGGTSSYVLYTADILTSTRLTTSTFADDAATLSRSKCPIQATAQLAIHLVDVEKCLSDWRIKVNEQKCKHVTFTPNRQNCPPLTLNKVEQPITSSSQ